jgi:hypothetical protein
VSTEANDQFVQALEEVQLEPGAEILVTGEARICEICEQVLRSLHPGVKIARTPDGTDRRYRVLVHGLCDSADLQMSLAALELDGEALVLVPPGEHVLELDFYPNIHRSSLVVKVRRVGGA